MTFKNLISENGAQISIGRLTFWLLLCVCLWFWLRGADTPNTLFEAWAAMVLYNLGKKGVWAFDKMSERKHGGRNVE
ncbi:MAG: hypothetical protein AB7F25_07130 [Deferribacterales bacterium]